MFLFIILHYKHFSLAFIFAFSLFYSQLKLVRLVVNVNRLNERFHNGTFYSMYRNILHMHISIKILNWSNSYFWKYWLNERFHNLIFYCMYRNILYMHIGIKIFNWSNSYFWKTHIDKISPCLVENAINPPPPIFKKNLDCWGHYPFGWTCFVKSFFSHNEYFMNINYTFKLLRISIK